MKHREACQRLQPFLPEAAIDQVIELLAKHKVHLTLKKERATKWGDFYSVKQAGKYRISVNGTLNPYQFLMTLIHEIAHLTTLEKYGRKVPHHGAEWKSEFTQLMKPFLREEVFPNELLGLLQRHMINPKAAATTDTKLYKLLASYSETEQEGTYVEDIPVDDYFLYQNKHFQVLEKRRKKVMCLDLKTRRKYLFSPIAKVEKMSLRENV